MDENTINKCTVDTIAQELMDIWEYDESSCMKVCFMIKGMIALRDMILDDLDARPQKN